MLAIAIGIGTVAFVVLVLSTVAVRPLNLGEEWGIFLVQVVLVATPFVILALAGVRDRVPWILGGVLTAALWGYYLFDGIRYPGVNFGLAFLMLVSPVIISGACLVAAGVRRRSS